MHCVLLQGYHGDTSKMFMVGNVSEKAQDLCRVTKHCLDEAIKICGPGVPIREVGKVSSTTQELLHHSLVIVPCLQATCVNDCTNCKAVHIFPFSLSFFHTEKLLVTDTKQLHHKRVYTATAFWVPATFSSFLAELRVLTM